MGALPNFIVGIGGSAGGLSAYRAFLDAMSPDTGMAIVIISHLLPTANTHLAELLGRRSKMPVKLASTAMPLRPNHVYVIPPDADLLIENGAFKVVSPRTRRNAQVDVFFGSLAVAMGPRAIGVIMSGYDGDGTEGCKKIKAGGGMTFAQDMSAEVEGMPVSARASGCIDFVLPPDKIAMALQMLVRAPRERGR
jgi:two-component system CheB/CheR fusion protein